MAELTDEDEFLGPAKRAVLDNDVQSFSKQRVCISQFWPIASVVDNCILIDNKLAIPFKLRSAILTRLRRSHPGQQAMIEAAEYIWWSYMNRQIVKKCQECMECTKFGKNLKSSKTFNSSLPLPPLVATNYSQNLLDRFKTKKKKSFHLSRSRPFLKFSVQFTYKKYQFQKVIKFLEAYICIYGIRKSIRTDHGSGFKNTLLKDILQKLKEKSLILSSR